MAKYIHCEDCKKQIEKAAEQFGELYEVLKGNAIKEMLCDGCADNIKIGETCFAAVLLPNNKHFNYEKHKPVNWAFDFINVITTLPLCQE